MDRTPQSAQGYRGGSGEWLDTFHFSLPMGDGMLESLTAKSNPTIPDNFLERLTPDRVAQHVESRRQSEVRST